MNSSLLKKKGGTLVIQPFPGIGDMIWYLPYLRAIARVEGPITLLTKSRSLTKEWLLDDPLIEDIIYLDRHKFMSMFLKIRGRHFQKSWTLHRSFSHAALTFLAGVPERLGLGYGLQRYMLSSPPYLAHEAKSCHMISQLNQFFNSIDQGKEYYLRSKDQVPPLCPQAQQDVIQKYTHLPRPWICFGIGASEDDKRWPASHFVDLGSLISEKSSGTIFLCGSKAEESQIQAVEKFLRPLLSQVQCATDLSLRQAFALMKEADLYIGNDTSLLNIAACFGTEAVGLFGGTKPLTYVPTIKSIVPSSDMKLGKEGMASISPKQVFEFLEHNHYI